MNDLPPGWENLREEDFEVFTADYGEPAIRLIDERPGWTLVFSHAMDRWLWRRDYE